MAEEIITQIPGYEAGKVARVQAEDEIGASFIIAQMVSDLRSSWNTCVAVLSLDGHKDTIEALIPVDTSIAKTFVLDQKNPDYNVISRKIEGMVHRKFVRAAIIGAADRLTKSDHAEREFNRLAKSENIPIILVDYPTI